MLVQGHSNRSQINEKASENLWQFFNGFFFYFYYFYFMVLQTGMALRVGKAA